MATRGSQQHALQPQHPAQRPSSLRLLRAPPGPQPWRPNRREIQTFARRRRGRFPTTEPGQDMPAAWRQRSNGNDDCLGVSLGCPLLRRSHLVHHCGTGAAAGTSGQRLTPVRPSPLLGHWRGWGQSCWRAARRRRLCRRSAKRMNQVRLQRRCHPEDFRDSEDRARWSLLGRWKGSPPPSSAQRPLRQTEAFTANVRALCLASAASTCMRRRVSSGGRFVLVTAMHTDFYAAYTLQWSALSPGARALQLGVIATRAPLSPTVLEVRRSPQTLPLLRFSLAPHTPARSAHTGAVPPPCVVPSRFHLPGAESRAASTDCTASTN
jgi:hypothetical protein